IPMRSKFSNNEQWFHEVGVESTLWHDIYIVLTSFRVEDQSIAIKINYNPTVKFVWTSLILMVLGAFISLSSFIPMNFSSKNARDVEENKSGITAHKKNHSLSLYLLVTFIFGLVILGFSSFCFAQSELKNYENIAHDLRCPTCQGLSILESETPQSIAMREEVKRLLQEGKSKNEILRYFNDRYGAWILREPDASSTLGKVIWGIPIAAFFCGIFFLVFFLSSPKRKQKKLADKLKHYVLSARIKAKS
ncbi:MAG: cytochrome c-type biogenesis protein CcmH, partial [Silvanigrellaceae bacterium]|nr:cytochrome c-type biogenesis protein CcmH [Silvanigrellaceae bacterium]